MQDCASTSNWSQEDSLLETKMDKSQFLTTCPLIVENIFKYLNGRTLCNCAQVCTFWDSMACTEKKRRKGIVSFCKVVRTTESTSLPASITFREKDSFALDHHNDLKQMRIHPALCMAFASPQFVEEFAELFNHHPFPTRQQQIRKRSHLTEVSKKALKEYLPVECPAMLVVAPGVIGCEIDRKPIEVEDGLALSGLIIPKAPGVEIKHFPITLKNCNVSNLVPEGTRIKCLLVFATSNGISTANKLLQSCLLKQNHVALGGGIVERSETMHGSAITFCGENVEAASVILSPHDRKEEAIAKLGMFKDAGFLRNKCFAYMFACVGRGRYLYGEHNVESSLFHTLYPTVPLVGLFGHGEIGLTYFPHLPSTHKVLRIGKFKKALRKYLHTYTTIFVMVSIKD